jgi:hypothetical protein
MKTLTIGRINSLLRHVGLTVQINSINDAVSTLWISLFEGLLNTRLPEIHRPPPALSLVSKAHNLQLLLKTLESFLHISLPHITVDSLLQKDPRSITNITDILWEIHVQLCKKDTLETQHEPVKSPVILADGSLDEFQSIDSPSQSPIPEENLTIDGFQSNMYKDVLSATSPVQFPVEGTHEDAAVPPGAIILYDNELSNDTEEVKNDSRNFSTPLGLKIRPNDTPHIKALKLKHSKLLRMKTMDNTKQQKIVEKMYSDELSRHKKSTIVKKGYAVNLSNFHYQPDHYNLEDDDLNRSNETPIVDLSEDDEDLAFGGKGRCELNLEGYLNKIVEKIPLVRGKIPYNESERGIKS